MTIEEEISREQREGMLESMDGMPPNPELAKKLNAAPWRIRAHNQRLVNYHEGEAAAQDEIVRTCPEDNQTATRQDIAARHRRHAQLIRAGLL